MGCFGKSPKPKPNYVIALIGATGAGKSTFMSKATGRTDIKISDDLTSCTQDVQTASLKLKGKQVTLIDTPGFDDTYRSDADILLTIANFLSATEQSEMQLAGLIFLQTVTDDKVYGSEKKRIRLIENILGKDAFPHLILATTKWSQLSNKKIGEAHVEGRKSKEEFWGYMISHGAEVVKHDNTKSSARKIVGKLLDKYTGPIQLQMQRELVQHNSKVALTSAGKIAEAALDESTQDLKRKLEIVDEKDQDEIDDVRKRLDKAEADKKRLHNATVTTEKVVEWLKILTKVAGAVGEVALCLVM